MSKNTKKIAPKRSLLKDIKRDKWLYIFLIPIMLYFFIFKYVPMFGTIMAFQDFKFSTGFFESKWVGLEHFKRLFTGNNFFNHFKKYTAPECGKRNLRIPNSNYFGDFSE